MYGFILYAMPFYAHPIDEFLFSSEIMMDFLSLIEI